MVLQLQPLKHWAAQRPVFIRYKYSLTLTVDVLKLLSSATTKLLLSLVVSK